MTSAAELAAQTLERVLVGTGATEVPGADGGAYMTLTSPMSPDPVGAVRVFSGGLTAKIVNIGMTVAPIGLDSHMIFAFTAADSPIPHFTLDSVEAGDMNAFHLDLIPRCDIGVNVDYIDAAFAPLEDTYAEAQAIDGLSAAHLSRRQWAIMSPWMLANRATTSALGEIAATVSAYLDHWLGLFEAGLTPELCRLTPEQLADRDLRHRAALFSPELDPVWNQVDQLVGGPTSQTMQEILRTNEITESP